MISSFALKCGDHYLINTTHSRVNWKRQRGCACSQSLTSSVPRVIQTRLAALAVWERAWERVVPFLAFPTEIRRVVYTTNTVESLNMQIRKIIKTRGHFPNDDAALRLIWLAIMRAKPNWRTCYNWTNAMAVLRIHYGDRIPDQT
jgi:transposase-like protein